MTMSGAALYYGTFGEGLFFGCVENCYYKIMIQLL